MNSKLRFTIRLIISKLLNVKKRIQIKALSLSTFILSYLYVTLIFPFLNLRIRTKYPPLGTNKVIGLYLSTPGIIRLLDKPINLLISRKDVTLLIFTSKNSILRKFTNDHKLYIDQLRIKGGDSIRFEIIPKFLEGIVMNLAAKLERCPSRVELNVRFFQHPELQNEKIAFERASQFYNAEKSESLLLKDRQEIESDLQNSFSSSVITNYFNSFKLDTLILAPIVNAHECEVIAFSVKNSLSLVGVVASWDNLTIKGQLLDLCDTYIVWGNGQKEQGVKYHGIEGEKFFVSGPYPFYYIFEFLNYKSNIPPRLLGRTPSLEPVNTLEEPLKVIWVCSSSLIIDSSKNGKFCEMDDIANFLKSLRIKGIQKIISLHVRLHPLCGYSIKEAVLYLESKHEIIMDSSQFTKKEIIFKADRQKYLDSLNESDFVIGYATSAIIEAGLLAKSAIAPLSENSTRSYKNILHGSVLTSYKGGPVYVLEDFESLVEHMKYKRKYSPNGEFAKLLGLDLNFSDFSESFVSHLLIKRSK